MRWLVGLENCGEGYVSFKIRLQIAYEKNVVELVFLCLYNTF